MLIFLQQLHCTADIQPGDYVLGWKGDSVRGDFVRGGIMAHMSSVKLSEILALNIRRHVTHYNCLD